MASRRSYSDKAHSGVTCYAKLDNDEEDDDDDVTTIPLIGILALSGRPRSSQLSTSLPKIDDSIISSLFYFVAISNYIFNPNKNVTKFSNCLLLNLLFFFLISIFLVKFNKRN
jgi:hypothetical protein